MGKFLIFLQLEPFPHYFVFTQALNLSNKKWKRAQLDQYIDKKTKTLWNNDVHPLKYGRIFFLQFLIFLELEPFLYYFVFTKTLDMSNKKWKLS